MGTRSGDIDPAVFGYLADAAGMSAQEVTTALNKESGLLGLSGLSNDMREVRAAAVDGDERAALALEVFAYRLAKHLAALVVPLGRLDALVFTGGIGENDSSLRARVLASLGFLGLDDRSRTPTPSTGATPPDGSRSADRTHDRDGRADRRGAHDRSRRAEADDMTRTLLVVPTGPSVGLTSACLGLLRALDERGVRVGYLKPLAQPRADDREEGSTALVAGLTAAAPAGAGPGRPTSRSCCRPAASTPSSRRWSTAGSRSPPTTTWSSSKGLNPGPTQIYSSRLNQAMAKALGRRGRAGRLRLGPPHLDDRPRRTRPTGPEVCDHLAERLAITAATYSAGSAAASSAASSRGFRTIPSRATMLAEALDRHSLTLLGAVPFYAELTYPRVADLAREMHVEVLSEGDLSRRIKSVAIFAQSVPGGLRVLTEGRLVVVPGDRHDVVMATCLSAPRRVRRSPRCCSRSGSNPTRPCGSWPARPPRPGCRSSSPTCPTFEASARVREIDVDLSADDLERAEAVMAHGAKAIDADALTSDARRAGGPAAEPGSVSLPADRARQGRLGPDRAARGHRAAYGAGCGRVRRAWDRPTGPARRARGGRAGGGQPRPDAASRHRDHRPGRGAPSSTSRRSPSCGPTRAGRSRWPARASPARSRSAP